MTRTIQSLILIAILFLIPSITDAQVVISVDKRIRVAVEAVDNAVWFWVPPQGLLWTPDPMSPNVIYLDEMTPAGTYRIHVNGVVIDYENKTTRQLQGFTDVVVGTRPVDPVDPTDPVDPVDPPSGVFDYLTDEIPKWARSVPSEPIQVDGNQLQSRAIEAGMIAASFAEFSEKTGRFDSIAAFTQATSDQYKEAIGVAGYQPWSEHVFQPLMTELRSLRDAGKLTSLEHYGPAWKAIAAGFANVE